MPRVWGNQSCQSAASWTVFAEFVLSSAGAVYGGFGNLVADEPSRTWPVQERKKVLSEKLDDCRRNRDCSGELDWEKSDSVLLENSPAVGKRIL